jgi:hypothetical protein
MTNDSIFFAALAFGEPSHKRLSLRLSFPSTVCPPPFLFSVRDFVLVFLDSPLRARWSLVQRRALDGWICCSGSCSFFRLVLAYR